MSRSGAGAGENADNEYFEDENLAFLPADHPLLARLQNALRKTLEEEHERVHLQLKEREAKLKKLERSKEDVGVQLYGVQQNLAEMQLHFEQTHENYNLIQKLRVEAEQKLSVLNQEFGSKKGQVEQLDKNLIKATDELSKLNRTLKELDEYIEKMKSEISVTRRTTYRAEENIANQEKSKKHQDFLIDHLNEQLKKFKEQKVILEAQLIAQKDETKSARDILREAQVEMENIQASKKNVLERWQKALLEMQRRDKALQVAREALEEQYEINIQLGAEMSGINNEIKKTADMSETLTANLSKLRMEEDRLQDERQRLRHAKEKLDAQISILTQSLRSTEDSTAQVERENKNIDDQMNIIEGNIMKIHAQTKTLYEHIINRISEHKTLEKKAANMLKQATMVAQEIEEKYVEIETLENEMARVNIDKLNTTNQIDMLKNKKREVSKERKEKEETVATYELEIRQGHDINEKKQNEVGKLNKLHDELMSHSSEVSRGPLEAHRNHLDNQKKEKTKEIQELERDWIIKQTNLVQQHNGLSKIQVEADHLKTKTTILEQKRMRLTQSHAAHEKEIRNIQDNLKKLRNEMNKLNDGLSKNQDSETKLKNENFNIQSEFMEKLKELEKSNVSTEVEIDRLKEEKAELLQSIVEAERQILLWERKIILEKEIQEALDPNIGQSEIQTLKKEIHRMELRLEELRKKQEEDIKEMERAVFKKEAIQLKYTKSEHTESKKKKEPESQGQVNKQIQNLKNALSQATKNKGQYENMLKQKQDEIDKVNNLIEESIDQSTEAENDLNIQSSLLTQRKIERLTNVFDVVKLQSQYKAYDAIANNKFKLDFSEHVLKTKFGEQRDLNMSMLDVIQRISQEYPQYSPLVDSLLNLAQS
jgi:chromosome segregation ATPase